MPASKSHHLSDANHYLPHWNFRAFVEALREDDDLVENNDEIDPHLKAGAIIRKVGETNGKAPLSNNMKGAKDGLWRVLGAPAVTQHKHMDVSHVILGYHPQTAWRRLLTRCYPLPTRGQSLPVLSQMDR